MDLFITALPQNSSICQSEIYEIYGQLASFLMGLISEILRLPTGLKKS